MGGNITIEIYYGIDLYRCQGEQNKIRIFLKLNGLYSHILILSEYLHLYDKKRWLFSCPQKLKSLYSCLVIFIYKIRVVAISHCCMSLVQLHLLFNSRKAVRLHF